MVGAPIVAEVTAPGAVPGSTDKEMRVFFGSADGRMRSRDVFQALAPTATFPVLADPPLAGISAAALVMDDRVFFGTDDGQVWALDAGELQVPVWEAPFEAQSKVTVAPVGLDGFGMWEPRRACCGRLMPSRGPGRSAIRGVVCRSRRNR